MRRLFIIILAGFTVTLLTGCYSSKITKEEETVMPGWSSTRQPLPLAQRKKVAVLAFDDQTDYGHGRIGRSAASILTTYLDRSGQFTLYEREKLDRIIEEQQIASDGKYDANTAALVGRTAKVDFVIIGSVSSFGYRTLRNQVLIFSSSVKRIAEATVDVRLVDVETGRIIASESGRGIAEDESKQVLGVGASAGYDETMAGNALRAAISKFVDKLIDQSLDMR